MAINRNELFQRRSPLLLDRVVVETSDGRRFVLSGVSLTLVDHIELPSFRDGTGYGSRQLPPKMSLELSGRIEEVHLKQCSG